MPFVAPWTIPPDYIAAARAGAALGLQRSQISNEANSAAGRLGLGYAQLASEERNATRRAAESRGQAAQELMLRKSLAEETADMRRAVLGETSRHNQAAEAIDQSRADSYAANTLKTENVAKATSKLFTLAGKPRDEIAKAIASDPAMREAASTLTGAQWNFLLPKEQYDTITETIPATEEIPEHKTGWFGIGGETVPAVPATNAKRITRRVPMAADALTAPPAIIPTPKRFRYNPASGALEPIE